MTASIFKYPILTRFILPKGIPVAVHRKGLEEHTVASLLTKRQILVATNQKRLYNSNYYFFEKKRPKDGKIFVFVVEEKYLITLSSLGKLIYDN